MESANLTKRKREKRSGHRDTKRGVRVASPIEHGFDFGIEFHAVLVTDGSFIELLKEAEIVACAYRAPDGPFGGPIRELTLVGLHPEPLIKVFSEFNRWAVSGDGDAVELGFIFLKDGGYLLTIEQEPRKATRRLGAAGGAYSPLLVGGTFIKKFDTRHPALVELRDFKRRLLISPFLFGAASLRPGVGSVPSLSDIQPIPNVPPLLKFEAEFVDEEMIKPGARQHSAITIIRQSEASLKTKAQMSPAFPSRRPQQPRDYFQRRRRIVDRFFPVTVERIRAGRYSEVMDQLRGKGVKEWQSEQAACNLLLSAYLCNGLPFYRDIPPEKLSERILKSLEQRGERSDTPELTRFSIDDLVTQVCLDAIALLRERAQKVTSATLDEVQRKLEEWDLLEMQDV